MKRYSVVRILSNALEDGDVGIFIGDGICSEALAYDRPGNLYLSDAENLLSLGLGIAMCSKRRVFIFCEDSYFLNSLSDASHIATSKCNNIFLVVLATGIYTDVGEHPTIFNSLSAPKAMLYDMGFIVHNYTKQFKNSRNPVKEINAIWSRSKGPLAVIVEVDKGVKKENFLRAEENSSLKNIINFIKDLNTEIYEYKSPISINEILGEKI